MRLSFVFKRSMCSIIRVALGTISRNIDTFIEFSVSSGFRYFHDVKKLNIWMSLGIIFVLFVIIVFGITRG